MIGLVAVSHSAALARAAAELALQMGGAQPPRLELAAGTPDGGLGTDAAAIAEAIHRADSGDGVLVLMDLGSAILSTEMAQEFLPPEVRVRLSAAPFVEGLVAAVVSAASGASLDDVDAEVSTALAAKARQLGRGEDAAAQERTGPQPEAADADAEGFDALIRNPSGLHARPAAAFARTAGRYDARVRVRDLSRDVAPVAGDSLLALMALGVGPGTRVRVTAEGPQASAVLAELRAMIDDGFGEM
ncbi:dihydroxyacetone kinase phosphoryl donor subunit DhaM [Microbacterium sp. NPDC091313]